MDNPIPQPSPQGVAASIGTGSVTYVANSIATAPIHAPSLQDFATAITVLSGTLSILISLGVILGWLISVWIKFHKENKSPKS
jgi:hypothetical protein